MFKIQYASDLHLEFWENTRFLENSPLLPEADVLVLAGDMGYLGSDNYARHPFWDWAASNYEQVIAIPGNHEFYQGYDLGGLHDGWSMEIRPNVRCFYNAVIPLTADIDLIASTLWGHIEPKDAFVTERSVAESKAKHIVVATHHVPSYELVSPQFMGSPINGAFTVEMGNYIACSPIEYWIYGHSHRNIDKVIGDTRCVSNQFGWLGR